MIDEVDAALAALLHARLGADVAVDFSRPADSASAVRGRSVTLYLHDVREDIDRRFTDFDEVRGDNGRVRERRMPVRRYQLSYSVTVRAADDAAEHRLLGQVIACLARDDAVPGELCSPSLRRHGLPVLLALWPRRDPAVPVTDVWSALGAPLRPSVDLLVTAPLDLDVAEPAGPPVETRLLEASRREGVKLEARRAPRQADEPSPAGSGARRRAAAPRG